MKKTKILDLVCIAVMLAVAAIQFLPYWFYEGQSTSVQMYIWFPDRCKDLTNLLNDVLGKDFTVNDIILGPITLLVTPVVASVLYFVKPRNYIIRLLPVAAAIIGLWEYLSHPVFQLGFYYTIHLVSIIVMLIIGAVNFGFSVKAQKQLG